MFVRLILLAAIPGCPESWPIFQFISVGIADQKELTAGAANGRHGLDGSNVATENPDAAPSTLTDLIRKQARAMLVDQQPALIPRLVKLPAEAGLPDLQLRNIRCRDGVLRASFQLQQPASQSTER